MRTRPDNRRRAAQAEQGAVAVEFALVLPLLVLLLLGTLTAGLAYSRAIGIQNAVREGARFGATADVESASWANDVLQRVRETQFDDDTSGGSSSTTVCVRVVGAKTIGPSCSTAGVDAPPAPSFGTPPATAAGTCTVQVAASRRSNIITGMLPTMEAVIDRSASARYERACG